MKKRTQNDIADHRRALRGWLYNRCVTDPKQEAFIMVGHHQKHHPPTHDNGHLSLFKTPIFGNATLVRCHRHRGKLVFLSMSLICLSVVGSIIRVDMFFKVAAVTGDRSLDFVIPQEIQKHGLDPNDDPASVPLLAKPTIRAHKVKKEMPSHMGEIQPPAISIDRIYYTNLDANPKRKEFMEDWLWNNQTVAPFQRIAGQVGNDNDICGGKKLSASKERCRGVAGLSKSMVNIIDNFNTSGTTLVLEDDFRIWDLSGLVESLNRLPIPNDWDILRLDCWGDRLSNFVPRHHSFGAPSSITNWTSGYRVTGIFETKCTNANRTGNVYSFCGGTHAMLWRGGESVRKLRSLWGQVPYIDIDCRLTRPFDDELDIKSYCINQPDRIGASYHPNGERTNIPKIGD